MVSNGRSIEVVQSEDAAQTSVQCLGKDTSLTKEVAWQVSPGNTQWRSVKDNEAITTTIPLVTSNVTINSNYICEPMKTQGTVNNQLKIKGNDTVCFSGSSHNYLARTNNKGIPIQWIIDSSQKASLTILNDSMVSVSFKGPIGSPLTVMLYAYAGSCEVIKDSIAIHLFPGNNKLVGNYNSCDLPLKLYPGHWFKNYLWQDGSTDSVYVITKAGKYMVKLQTFCGDYITDSIEISGAETGMVKNFVVCKNDSVTIEAPPGFAKYEWTPTENLILLSPDSIRVYPESNTFYILKTTTSQGCELTDTIFVKVNEGGVINLGRDTSLCQNEVFSLKAGTGFSSYTWNTGESTPNITIKMPGIFFVTATNANGCMAKDSIIVKGKECKNSFYIPNAFTPNGDGKNDLFKPQISGPIEEYELVIYNRFGEIVFKTKHVNNGWSGKYKGIQQESNVYLWVCKYRFVNEKLKMEQGTVTLIL
jgi:gliding motility-associated-like protein